MTEDHVRGGGAWPSSRDHSLASVPMTPFCDDPKAYAAIPDEFFDCLIPRRHVFPLSRQKAQHVREAIGPSKDDTLDMTEYYGMCERCGSTRTLWRDRYTREFLSAHYVYPEGYLAPMGTRWDPALLWAEWQRRHPVKGRVKTHRG